MSQRSTEDLVKHLAALGLAVPGTSGGQLMAGAIVDATAVTGAVTQSTDNLLNSVSLPANTLSAKGRGLIIAAFGTTAANANAKDLKVFLGTDAICTVTGTTANAKSFYLVCVLFRVSASVQIGFALAVVDGAIVAASSINFAGTQTETAAITIKSTGNNTAAAASAATGKGLLVLPFAA